ncbi:hypothetical protein Tsubulata_002454 [Turnera subulata]|uniref:MATH domain-containing protein n=1 Tax=Turnera subulata TaxID=218843 RepID=A0A9Q0F998_9ROSI|nr:hypothetical protein Tsubulata_002454 [Turnera subulata]
MICLRSFDQSMENKSPEKVFAHFMLRLRDQFDNNHYEITGEHWFQVSSNDWGFPDFIPVSDLIEEDNGYLVDGSIIIEAELILVSTTRDVS